MKRSKWIWLDEKLFPKFQEAAISIYDKKSKDNNFCIVEFARALILNKPAISYEFSISAQTKYFLYVNNKFIGEGPVYAGGDNGSSVKMDKAYYQVYTMTPDTNKLNINVLVRKDPTYGYESSVGRGAFIFECLINYIDGSTERIISDERWDVMIRTPYISPFETDFTKHENDWTKAKVVDVNCELLPSPIPNLVEEKIMPQNDELYVCGKNMEGIFDISFDKIYSGYPCFTIEGDEFEVYVCTSETSNTINAKEFVKGKNILKFKSLNMQSVGNIVLMVKNLGESDIRISEVHMMYIHYPIENQPVFETSDEDLNKIYNLCVHNLALCRQTLHLDSPMHKEPLGCVGDYYIQALMDYFTYGDTKLTRFDIVRIGDYLRLNDGVMFHTTYSLIWVNMIWDYYMFTSDISILVETATPRMILDEKFKSYLGSDGVIEKAPNYMFVDWINIDGFSLHHPPKALGQAVLSAFYINYLDIQSKIFDEIGDTWSRTSFRKRLVQAKKAFNDRFLDIGVGLYKGGLGNVSKMPITKWNPENVNKKYFIRHPNILAVLYDICPDNLKEELAINILTNPDLGPLQPYFMHFMLDMIWKMGMFEEYGIEIIKTWLPVVEENPKGLAEGWGDFKGDYSHAWGGTPAYQLPRAFLGFEMIKPGFKEISLKPNMFGLDYVKVAMPTPYGNIECEMIKGNEPKLIIPDEIKYTIKEDYNG